MFLYLRIVSCKLPSKYKMMMGIVTKKKKNTEKNIDLRQKRQELERNSIGTFEFMSVA